MKENGDLGVTVNKSNGASEEAESPFIYTDTDSGTQVIWKTGPSVDIKNKDGLVQK